MPNSSESDSEDDTKIRQLMEAADTMLFTNEMFQQGRDTNTVKEVEVKQPSSSKTTATPVPKSQRYLDTLDNQSVDHAGDLNFSNEVQTHIWRKLSAIIQQQVEFSNHQQTKSHCTKEPRSKIRLLRDADKYLKTDDDIANETEQSRPQKRQKIQRRQLEPATVVTADTLRALSVSGADILAGADMQYWAKRPPRQNKVFAYVADSNGVLHDRQRDDKSTSTKRRRK